MESTTKLRGYRACGNSWAALYQAVGDMEVVVYMQSWWIQKYNYKVYGTCVRGYEAAGDNSLITKKYL